MKIISDTVKYIKEYDSENAGNKSNIPIGDFISLPFDMQDTDDTKIFRCYDENKNLLGEIRPKPNDTLLDISF